MGVSGTVYRCGRGGVTRRQTWLVQILVLLVMAAAAANDDDYGDGGW